MGGLESDLRGQTRALVSKPLPRLNKPTQLVYCKKIYWPEKKDTTLININKHIFCGSISVTSKDTKTIHMLQVWSNIDSELLE